MAATFVRLKRKRCEEATDSLIVACKRGKVSETEGGTPGNSSTHREVFKLAGTVNSKDEDQLKQTIDVYKGFNAISALRAKGDTSSSSINHAASTPAPVNHHKVEQSKLMKDQEELRKLFPQTSPESAASIESSTRQIEEVVSKACRIAASASSASPSGVVVYDAVLKSDKKVSLISGGLPEDHELLCNGEKMTRVVNEAAEPSMDTDEDYVYDIFCLDQPESEVWQEMGEIFAIEAYKENFGPFAEYRTDGLYEDDEDSNAEDNWRNDYPDEMNSCSSEDNLEGIGEASGDCYGGGLSHLTLASSEDSSSGDNYGTTDYKNQNADFVRYYKSYKKARRLSRDDREESSSNDESFSDGYDDL
ncbi:probable RNA polymerase II nuclear localization protein SLC7A6OS [Watersipora subatra]|uniref:probable RNA polymerase II nuclear localization protein SLC7A6OS n=1 Tax=Watersipora subatra TaxID=2589382 RepID=UPI00355B37DE